MNGINNVNANKNKRNINFISFINFSQGKSTFHKIKLSLLKRVPDIFGTLNYLKMQKKYFNSNIDASKVPQEQYDKKVI